MVYNLAETTIASLMARISVAQRPDEKLWLAFVFLQYSISVKLLRRKNDEYDSEQKSAE
jgi:hypothetical protein